MVAVGVSVRIRFRLAYTFAMEVAMVLARLNRF